MSLFWSEASGDSKKHTQQFSFKRGYEIFAINFADILFFERNQRITIIHTSNGSYELSASLNALETSLSNRFFRSHRSYIINLDLIEKIVSWNAKSYTITFRYSDQEALLSRHRKNDLIQKLTLI